MFRLDQFFRVCDDDVKMPDGKSITMRVLSDIEMNGRQSYSLAKMTEVTKELRNPESDLHQQKIAPLSEVPRESLIETIVQSRRWELIREANELFRYDILPYPENATDLEKIEVENAQAKHEANVAKTRLKYVVDNEKVFRDRLETLGHRVDLGCNTSVALTGSSLCYGVTDSHIARGGEVSTS